MIPLSWRIMWWMDSVLFALQFTHWRLEDQCRRYGHWAKALAWTFVACSYTYLAIRLGTANGVPVDMRMAITIPMTSGIVISLVMLFLCLRARERRGDYR